MFIFPRSTLAVIAALVLAWLLPHIADRMVNGAPQAAYTALESTHLHAANAP